MRRANGPATQALLVPEALLSLVAKQGANTLVLASSAMKSLPASFQRRRWHHYGWARPCKQRLQSMPMKLKEPCLCIHASLFQANNPNGIFYLPALLLVSCHFSLQIICQCMASLTSCSCCNGFLVILKRRDCSAIADFVGSFSMSLFYWFWSINRQHHMLEFWHSGIH